MKIYDEYLGKEAVCTSNECPEESGKIFSLILLMIFMIAGNVLLINLLIAMFRWRQETYSYLVCLIKLNLSSIYQDVHENTEQIWKFQRYRLIFDYRNLLILPPPFIVFVHIFKLIQRLTRCKRTKNNYNKSNKIKNVQNYESKIGKSVNWHLLFTKFK